MKYVVPRDENIETQSLETTLEKIGYGRFQVGMAIILGILECFEAIEILLLSFLQAQLKCEWQITIWEDTLIVIGVFVGMLIGSPILGHLGDVYGRKPILNMCSLSIIYLGMLCAASPTVVWVTIMRMFMGAYLCGTMSSILTLATELTDISHRGNLIYVIFFFWSIGSYFITILWIPIASTLGWRAFLLISTSPIIILLPFLFFLPESPRFLLLKNRKEEALKVLNRIAVINRCENITDVIQPSVNKYSFRDMFHFNYLSTTLITSYLWFVCGLTFYGTVQIVTSMDRTNRRCLKGFSMISPKISISNSTVDDSCCYTYTWSNSANIFISITGEIASIPFSILMMNVIGRRYTISILGLCITGWFLALNICMSSLGSSIILFVLRGSVFAFFNTVIMYSTEVYPTSVRNFAIGVLNMLAKVGAIVSPFIVNYIMWKTSFVYGTLIFAFFNLLGCIGALVLPYETKDQNLLQTAEDIRLTEVNKTK